MVKKLFILSLLFLFVIPLNGGLLFDDVDDEAYLDNSTDVQPGTGAFTVMGWIKFDPNTTTIHDTFVKYTASGDAWFLQFTPGAANTVMYYQFRGTGGGENASHTISGDQRGFWHHFAGVRPVNGTGNIRLYWDGELINSSTARILNNNVTGGWRNVNIHYFSSTRYTTELSDCVIAKEELSAERIKMHYQKKFIPIEGHNTQYWLKYDGGKEITHNYGLSTDTITYVGTTITSNPPVKQIHGE